MAKIKFGMMMTDARGKLGGQVFSKNRSGSYIRTKVTPSNPRTPAQSQVRQALAAISAAWSALTQSQINAFNQAVNDWKTTNIFGDSSAPSGKTLFVKLNLNLANTNQAEISNVPEKLDMPTIPLLVATIDTVAGEVEVPALTAQAGFVLVVSATPMLSAGTSFYKGKFRQISIGIASVTNPATLHAAYVAKFGTPTAGANIAFQFKWVGANGQAGVPVVVRAVY